LAATCYKQVSSFSTYTSDGGAYMLLLDTKNLSQNSKNAKKSAIFTAGKGQLLTKFRARYVGRYATQAVSLRCH